MIRTLICAAALAAPVAAFAQSPVTIAAPVDGNVLRAGVKVPVRTLQELTTKKKALKAGDRINVEVAEAVMSGTNVIIPAGTPGMAEITTVRNKGMWGKSGSRAVFFTFVSGVAKSVSPARSTTRALLERLAW